MRCKGVVDWEPPARRGKHEPKDKKGGSRSVTLDGNPDVECGGVLLSHTLSSAVPSPRPGLSFRVRKGTGRLTWAMTTAKPIQRPTTRIGRQNRNHATIPIVAVREPDNGREQKRFTGIVSVTTRNNAPCHPTKETTTGRDPTHHKGKGWKVCRVRPLVPVGSTPRGASTSGLSNTCSTCGLQAPKCQGILILEQASRLDAFSGYPSRT